MLHRRAEARGEYLPQVRQCQLKVDHANVLHGVNSAVHVYDVIILEAAHHLSCGFAKEARLNPLVPGLDSTR